MKTKEERELIRKNVDDLLLSQGSTLTNKAVADQARSSPTTVQRRREVLGLPSAQELRSGRPRPPKKAAVRPTNQGCWSLQPPEKPQEVWCVKIGTGSPAVPGGGAAIRWTHDDGLTSSPPDIARTIMLLVRENRNGNTDAIRWDGYTALELVIRWLETKGCTMNVDLV